MSQNGHWSHFKLASLLIAMGVLLLGQSFFREATVKQNRAQLNGERHEESLAVRNLVKGCWIKQWWIPSYTTEWLLGNCRSLSRAPLGNADLRNADLRKANLSAAILRDADLRSANLSHANLRNADLSYADLSDADLSYADLSNGYWLSAADYSSTTFQDVNLSNANLFKANLSGSDLSNTILLNTDLRYARELVSSQLEGQEPPFLCNTHLPRYITVDPNRNCDNLPQVLVQRHGFKSLEAAEAYVDELAK